MKELSIEEKAKRYDESLEKAHKLCAYPTTKPFISDLQDLFPELKESEDERIRKTLIDFLDDVWHLWKNANFNKYGKADCADWIAWLEKQAEQESTDTDNKFLRMRETKPADIVEFLDRLTTVEQEFLWEHIEKVKKIDREEREQKSSWSEEDEQYLLVCKNALAKYQTTDKWDAHIISRWLEDKLKSLRLQKQWKPSDEQIIELRRVISGCSYDIEPLVELETKLKEL